MPSCPAWPTTSTPAAPAIRSSSCSAIASWTSTRAAAEHFWPAYTNAEDTIAGTASSRSASPSTITQFLPPSSATTRLMWRWPGAGSAAARTISRPTGSDPVNAIVATSGWRTSDAPTSPSPGSSEIAAGGTPPARSACTSRRALPGDCSAGLSTTELPVARAAEVIPQAIASGKFQGAITAVIPRGT